MASIIDPSFMTHFLVQPTTTCFSMLHAEGTSSDIDHLDHDSGVTHS